MNPYYETENGVLYNGDCLEIMKELESDSVNLVLTDPPYNINIAKWDKIDNYIEWMGLKFMEFQRLLKDNGSFYFFHNDFLQIAELQHWISKHTEFIFKQFNIWDKGDFRAISWKNPGEDSILRNWFPTCEYCLFYTFQDGTGLSMIFADKECFKSIKKYLDEELAASDYTESTIKTVLENDMASHYFGFSTREKSQFAFPTEKNYLKLQETGRFQREYKEFRQEYEDLRLEYEGLRQGYENLRYTFNPVKNTKQLWHTYSTNDGQEHLCKKPIPILDKILRVSSNPGDLVIDPFLGSGSTAVACERLDRKWIGIELSKDYCDVAVKRIEAENAQGKLF